jgi:lactoylglutathione lyase
MVVYNHVGHVVTDLELSRRFYEEVLGFEFWYDVEPGDEGTTRLLSLAPPLGLKAYYLVLGGFVLELIHYAAAEPIAAARSRTMNQTGLSHLSVSVPDVAAAAAKAAEFGGAVIRESDVGMAMMIRDPDGQLIELIDLVFRDSLPPKPGA